MFVLDFKPTFYNYPLTPQQFTRIKERQKEIANQLAEIQGQIEETYAEEKSDNFSEYRQRMKEKMDILLEQLKEYQQIAECHQSIEEDVRRKKMERSQVKNNMLLYYQGIMAEKSKKKVPSEERQSYASNQLALSDSKVQKTFGIPSRHSLGQMLVKYNMSDVSARKSKANPQSPVRRPLKRQQLKLPTLKKAKLFERQQPQEPIDLDISRHKINNPSVFASKITEKKLKHPTGKRFNFGLF